MKRHIEIPGLLLGIGEHPYVYAACRSAHLAGIDHGQWIALGGRTADEIADDVAEMLRQSPVDGAEDFMVRARRWFYGARVPTKVTVDELHAAAALIANYGKLAGLWLNLMDSWDNMDRFDECYVGTFESWLDYSRAVIRHLFHEFSDDVIAKMERSQYIRFDIAKYADDLSEEGFHIFGLAAGGVVVFRQLDITITPTNQEEQ